MRIAIVIATLGRPNEVGQLLAQLERQSLRPCTIVLSVESEADIPGSLPSEVRVVTGERGLPAQRNRGMDLVLKDCDVVAFYDDDFLPTNPSLEGIAGLFAGYPDVVGATGLVLADGIGQERGIDYQTALDVLATFDREPSSPLIIERSTRGVYGCNMAFRATAIGVERFDEKLPLYGWQEDVDFATRVSSQGRIVSTNAFAGVHRGVTAGRTSGIRLGYSQMVNPIYLVKKGTMRLDHAFNLMFRNFIANHAKMLRAEPWIDRKGRAQGNRRGISDLLRGHADPSVIMRLGS